MKVLYSLEIESIRNSWLRGVFKLFSTSVNGLQDVNHSAGLVTKTPFNTLMNAESSRARLSDSTCLLLLLMRPFCYCLHGAYPFLCNRSRLSSAALLLLLLYFRHLSHVCATDYGFFIHTATANLYLPNLRAFVFIPDQLNSLTV